MHQQISHVHCPAPYNAFGEKKDETVEPEGKNTLTPRVDGLVNTQDAACAIRDA